jgi:hypothetical protein
VNKIINFSVSGFVSTDEVILIFDNRKRQFYKRINPERKKCFFNLPTGEYFTSSNIVRGEIVVYDIPQIPKAEQLTKIPRTFYIVTGNNPNKCSVYLNKGKIFFDTQFLKSLNRPQLVYIIFHELAHYMYRGNGNQSEKNCDTFATAKMLEIGYNPNQILKANLLSLTNSHKSKIRKINTYIHTKKA